MSIHSKLHEQGSELEESEIAEAGSEPMDFGELEGIINSLITGAEEYIDIEEAPARVKASEYYEGKSFGNEEDGRSQVVTYDVRDTISLMLPQIMRTFFGPEKVGEYMPRNSEDVALSQQATDYVYQVCLSQDNQAFPIFNAVFKDALLKRVGII